MPRFTILSSDHSYLSAEVIAPDAGSVLPIVDQIGCRDADILKDGQYSFSLHQGGSGMWSIFQRDHVTTGRAFVASAPQSVSV